jgi:hypothetical protein
MTTIIVWALVITGCVVLGRGLNRLYNWHDRNRHNRWG